MAGPIEPRADFRNAAAGLYEMFVSLTSAGFTEHQALVLLGNMAVGGQNGDGK